MKLEQCRHFRASRGGSKLETAAIGWGFLSSSQQSSRKLEEELG